MQQINLLNLFKINFKLMDCNRLDSFKIALRLQLVGKSNQYF